MMDMAIHLVLLALLLLGHRPCSEAQGECEINGFRCLQSSECIPAKWRCDGDNDCSDASDERDCAGLTCAASQFSCGHGMTCIPKSWRCDGEADCSNSADERNCSVSTCTSDSFQCNNTRCISISFRCDGENDCGDGSDERECEEQTCRPNDFQCRGEESLTCIPTRWTCDGDIDCSNGSDESEELCESSALPEASCLTSEFQCLSGECIHASWKCDEESDCPDGSDELPSLCQTTECPINEYKCTSGMCVLATKVCDGVRDCNDASDEAECAPQAMCDDRDHFACLNKECIPIAQVCDGVANCPDSEDEPVDGVCDVNECDVNNGECEHVCVDRPYGHICTCREGYSLRNGSRCVDVDECNDLIVGICSQICQNTIGFYECQCDESYDFQQLNGRGHCRSKPVFGRPQLLLGSRRDIRIFDAADFNIDFSTEFQLTVISVDYDISPKSLFWAGVGGIHRLKFVPNKVPSPHLVMSNVSTVEGIAVDWVNDLIYWTDEGLGEIAVCNYDGSKKAVLIKSDLDSPRAIAVDPRSGLMFWSDWGNNARIERAGMNGEDRRIIVSENIGWPNGIAIDYTLDLLYWVDAKKNSINLADFEGGKRRVILSGADRVSHPFGITVFEDYVYWTDWYSYSVQRADKFTGSNQTAVITEVDSPMGLSIFHPLRQPDNGDAAPCSHDNAMCSHLCVAAPRVNGEASYSCLCQDNVKLSFDGHTCEGDTSHIG